MSDTDDNTKITNVAVLLARIDERTKSMQTDLTSLKLEFNTKLDNTNKENREKYTELSSKITELSEHINDNFFRKSDIDKNEFVKKSEFIPIRNLNYGLVGIILSGVLAAILKLVGL